VRRLKLATTFILEMQHRRKIAAAFCGPEIFHLGQVTWQTAVTFVVSHCRKINVPCVFSCYWQVV